MALIQSDDANIEKHVQRIESLIEEGGGALHSEVVIRSEGGNLTVGTKERMRYGREIIRLTRKTVLPEDQYNIVVKGDEFDVSFDDNCIMSDLQKRLTEAMIALYNETNKVPLHRVYSTYLSLREYPDVMDLIAEGRAWPEHVTKWRQRFKEEKEEDIMSDFLVQTFLKTRFLGYGDMIRATNVSILMPVIDFLNHHWDGGGFNIAKGGPRGGDLTMGSYQPVPDSTECFAFYGTMDALDSYLRYDFPDMGVPLVRSVPVDIDIPDFCKVEVKSPPGGMGRKKLGKALKPLSKYMPNFIDRDDGSLLVSHLIIPVEERSPNALVRVLGFVLEHVEKREGRTLPAKERIKWLKGSEQKVLEETKAFYLKLLDCVEGKLKDHPDARGLKAVQGIAKRQLEKLDTYTLIDVNTEAA